MFQRKDEEFKNLIWSNPDQSKKSNHKINYWSPSNLIKSKSKVDPSFNPYNGPKPISNFNAISSLSNHFGPYSNYNPNITSNSSPIYSPNPSYNRRPHLDSNQNRFSHSDPYPNSNPGFDYYHSNEITGNENRDHWSPVSGAYDISNEFAHLRIPRD